MTFICLYAVSDILRCGSLCRIVVHFPPLEFYGLLRGDTLNENDMVFEFIKCYLFFHVTHEALVAL